MDLKIKGMLNLNLVEDPDELAHLKLVHDLVLNRNNIKILFLC